MELTMTPPTYRKLRSEKIIQTQERLQNRIEKDFPSFSLVQVASELLDVAKEAANRAEEICRPYFGVRVAVGVLILGTALLALLIARSLRIQADLEEVMNLVQFVEAGLSATGIIGLAVF